MDRQSLCILQINTLDIRGGAAKVSWNLFNSLRSRGHKAWMAVAYKESHDPDVFTIPNDDYRSKPMRICASFQKRLERYIGRIRGVGRLIQILRDTAEPMRYIRRWLGREDFDYPGTWRLLDLLPQKPDIIHCHNLHGGYFDLRTLPWLSSNIPTLLTLHDAWLLSGHCAHSLGCERWKASCGKCPDLTIYPPLRYDATAYNLRRKREIYAKSRLYLVTPSRWLMRKVEESILMPAIIKRRVIPNGVDTSIFHPSDKNEARRKLGLPIDADILLFAGHGIKDVEWRNYKMVEDIAERLSLMSRTRQLLIICLGAKEENKNFKDVNICFAPFQTDPEIVAKYYQAADIYMHPAKEDTFPTVVLESLACATPAIATNVGGIPEIIEDGKTGFLVPPEDTCPMAIRVKELLDEKGLLEVFSKNASEYASTKFNLDKQIDNYLSFYYDILEEWQNDKGNIGWEKL